MSYIQKEYYSLIIKEPLFETRSSNVTILRILNQRIPREFANIFGIAYRENDDFPKEYFIVLNRDDVRAMVKEMAKSYSLELALIHASPLIFTQDQGFAFIGNADLFELRPG